MASVRLSPVDAAAESDNFSASTCAALSASAAGFPKLKPEMGAKGAALGFSWKVLGVLAASSGWEAAALVAPNDSAPVAAAEDAGWDGAPKANGAGNPEAASPNGSAAGAPDGLMAAGASEAAALAVASAKAPPSLNPAGCSPDSIELVLAAEEDAAAGKEKGSAVPPKEKPAFGVDVSSNLAFFSCPAAS